ncbi:MAG: hypothetical protein NTY99_03015 [DPANN group archaeon]|nr:hypothetical protein [DPANN group archaeon]
MAVKYINPVLFDKTKEKILSLFQERPYIFNDLLTELSKDEQLSGSSKDLESVVDMVLFSEGCKFDKSGNQLPAKVGPLKSVNVYDSAGQQIGWAPLLGLRERRDDPTYYAPVEDQIKNGVKGVHPEDRGLTCCGRPTG